MTEADAREWLERTLDVPRETFARIEQFVTLLLEANAQQNLIGASTIATLWARHIVDSAQLLRLAPPTGRWIDIGSGAGFPGMIVALLGAHAVTLVESRTRRARFLADAVGTLGLAHVEVLCAPIEAVYLPPATVISARAVAPLDRLFASARHLADSDTLWLLPKGRSAASELAVARETWQGAFAMEPSITDPDAAIVVARDVGRKARA